MEEPGGYKCLHPFPVKRKNYAGRKVGGADYGFVLLCFGNGVFSHKISDNSVGNVADVGGTGFHIFVFHGIEHLDKVVGGDCHRILRIQHLSVYNVVHRIVVVHVFKHHLLNLENCGMGFSHFRQCLLVNFSKLGGGHLLCLLVARFFLIGIFNVNAAHIIVLLLEQRDFTYCYCIVYAFSCV